MNVAVLLLPAGLLAGWAALVLELAWLRTAGAALPGVVPAAALIVPTLLLAWTLGSALAGRLADRTLGALGPAARWLALGALAAGVLPGLLAPLLPESAPGSTLLRAVLGAVPALPAIFALGGALPLLARVRRAHALSAARSAGGVAVAVALGGAAGAASLPALLAHGPEPTLAAGLALAAAALLCFLLDRVATPAVAGQRMPSGADGAVAARAQATGSTLPLALAAVLGGALLVGGQLLLLRAGAQLQGDSLSTTLGVLVALHLGMALGALVLCHEWSNWQPGALVALLLALSALGLAWPGGLVGQLAPDLDPLLPSLLLGLGAGSLVTAAARAGRRPFGTWVGDLAALSTLGGVGAGLAHRAALGAGQDSPELLRLCALVAAGGALLMVLWALVTSGRRWTSAAACVLVLLAGAAVLLTPAPVFPWRSGDDEVALVERMEGAHGVTDVVALADGGLRLKVDGRFGMGGTGAALLERRLGRMAAALAPNAERVLVLGLGGGQTLAGVAGLTRAAVDCVERNGALAELQSTAGPFEGRIPGPLPVRAEALSVHVADARAWVSSHPGSYDLVVGDLFFPWVTGAGDLLAQEHLEAVRRCLRPGGVFVQWLPLHQLTWPAFGAAARAFVHVFPGSRAFCATPLAGEPLVALVGGLESGVPGEQVLAELFAGALDPAGPNGPGDLYDSHLCDGWELTGALGEGERATLAHPLTELMTQGRVDDEADIARWNTALLADLCAPLITTSLSQRPRDALQNRELGALLNRRSVVLSELLRARAALLEQRPLDATVSRQRPRRQELDGVMDRALLAAWSELPGHAATRAALLERARLLTSEERWKEAAVLLHAALEAGRDVPLAAMLGGIFTRLGFLDEALHLLRGARQPGPGDRSLLINLGTALLHSSQDDEAREVLSAAAALGPLPTLQGAALGLLIDESTLRETAEVLEQGIAEGEAWKTTLRRLLDRQPG